MRAQSLLLSHLAKTSHGNNYAEATDGMLHVPPILYPTIDLALPFFNLYIAPPGTTQAQSFMLSSLAVFNAALITTLIAIDAGVWDIFYRLSLQESGAVSDPTSTASLILQGVESPQPIVLLARITNKQGLNQQYQGQFTMNVLTSTQYSLRIDSVAGLGTGLNLYNVLLVCRKKL